MIYKNITSANDPLFKKCREIYCSNFPLNERRDLLEQKRALTYNNYRFIALLQKNNHAEPILVGILAYWNFSQVIFGEHLAIDQSMQGMGIGKIAIDYLKDCSAKEFDNKPIVLEIEIPNDFTTKRRESFYKKLDFKINPHEHFQPCYHKADEPIEMLIMSWPHIIDNQTYSQFYKEQQEIMPHF
ncbi:MAG: GNAT family N-acetyltransferase [Bacteroidales bacterium]